MTASKNFNPKEMTWPLATTALLLLCLVMAVILLGSGDYLAGRALEQGRRIAIEMSTGNVTGKPYTSPAPEPSAEVEVETPAEPAVSAVVPDTVSSSSSMSSSQSSSSVVTGSALPGDFTGATMESQSSAASSQPSVLDAPPEDQKKNAEEYPIAVAQEPQTQTVASAAPQPQPVRARDLLVEAPPGEALPLAPLEALTEKAPEGELPKISAKGKRPWRVYAKPFTAAVNEPLVAVIVGDLGMDHTSGQQALKLDQHFTYSFSPYGVESEVWARTARSRGHEILLDLPMQAEDFPASDPGPLGILFSLKAEDNVKRARIAMSKVQGYVGLLAPMNAAMPESVIKPVLSDIAARGLLFVRTASAIHASGGGELQDSAGLTPVTASLTIDADPSEAAIRARLSELVALAQKDGQALGIARALPVTLEMLQQWHKELAAQGVRLAPVSALAERAAAVQPESSGH
jgi:uncharacterized protein